MLTKKAGAARPGSSLSLHDILPVFLCLVLFRVLIAEPRLCQLGIEIHIVHSKLLGHHAVIGVHRVYDCIPLVFFIKHPRVKSIRPAAVRLPRTHAGAAQPSASI